MSFERDKETLIPADRKVVDFEVEKILRRPHLSGTARCVNCGHEWDCRAPLGVFQMECDKCHTNGGVWMGLAKGSLDHPRYTCVKCGNWVFVLDTVALICTRCGEHMTGWYMGQDPDPPPPPPRKSA